MKVLITGATGMVGHGVLGECLLDRSVDNVITLGRSTTGRTGSGLREIMCENLIDLTGVADELAGIDAVFFCLGVSSAGMKSEDYRRVTYDYTLSVAAAVMAANPDVIFIYVSGAGTDSTERGRSEWASVKGETENALLDLIPNAYMFRPGIIRPLKGATSKTRSYRVIYAITAPLLPLLQRIAPTSITTTTQIGVAMVAVAKFGHTQRILNTEAINALSTK